MKKLVPLLLIAQIATFNVMVFGQKRAETHIDSLIAALRTAKEDTDKVKILNNLSRQYEGITDYTNSCESAKNAIALSERIGYKKGKADALNNIGIIYDNQGNYNDALKEYNASLKIREEIRDKKGIAYSHNNIGLVYWNQGQYPEALQEYFSSLKILEEIGDKKGVAATHNNIGLIYHTQGDDQEALKQFTVSLKIKVEIGDKRGVALLNSNIGMIYINQDNYPEGLKKYLAALKISEEIGDKFSSAQSHYSIGIIYKDQGNYPEALKELFTSLKIREEIGDKKGIAWTNLDIGLVKVKMKNAGEGKLWIEKGLTQAKEIRSKELIKVAYGDLAEADSVLGNYKEALANYKLQVLYRDSLLNEENTRKLTQQQMVFQFDKIQDSVKVEQEKKEIVSRKELQKQKFVRNGFIGGFLVMLLFALVFFWQRNKTKKEKKRSEDLILNILPGEVAEELKTTGQSKARAYTMVTVMFTDFKDFTKVSEMISAELLVEEIHECFSGFDQIIQNYKIEKIKTIGDSYLCASGLPVSNYTHALDMVKAGIEICRFMQERKKEKEARGEISFELRVGIHTGPVVAGIVGVKKYAYDIWGDTVNIAARMEQNSEAGKINISGSTYELVKEKFRCEHRGKIEAKNKGVIDMYFVETPGA